MTRSRDLSGRLHHGLPVDCDEYPSTPYKSLGQTLTGEQKENLQRSIRLLENKMLENQGKAKNKKEEDEEAKAT
ncbi:hypothetical protein QBC32DRAFT_318271 [Pseudoneurospora amorphoporcata]|uniref:Uncharacterized protein n=1 Tax=Pseudoneurospora amorphoporcata TaxID=241081 RepID=A0AAN6NLU8_9PEZI|nr:hypothetical protein QBC32DRAFT_318271 [Pseudoneurospora amorphoporcata]